LLVEQHQPATDEVIRCGRAIVPKNQRWVDEKSLRATLSLVVTR